VALDLATSAAFALGGLVRARANGWKQCRPIFDQNKITMGKSVEETCRKKRKVS
jgi:hypothetical protein